MSEQKNPIKTPCSCWTDYTVLLGQNPLQAEAATIPSAPVEPQASDFLLWPFHFTVAEDDISKAAYGNQVATSQWEVDLSSEITL